MPYCALLCALHVAMLAYEDRPADLLNVLRAMVTSNQRLPRSAKVPREDAGTAYLHLDWGYSLFCDSTEDTERPSCCFATCSVLMMLAVLAASGWSHCLLLAQNR
jgi:hypothetical protein